MLRGIGLVSCVYVNGETGQFWVIDDRLYDPDGDGHSKLDQVSEMLNGVVHRKQLPFKTVLMDSGYATQKLMAQIDPLDKRYYCPLKRNRRVDDSGGKRPISGWMNCNGVRPNGFDKQPIVPSRHPHRPLPSGQ